MLELKIKTNNSLKIEPSNQAELIFTIMFITIACGLFAYVKHLF